MYAVRPLDVASPQSPAKNVVHRENGNPLKGRTRCFAIPFTRTALAGALTALAAGPALAQEFKARLNGFFEIGALDNNTGAILTN